jgi:hypothetical protein
MKAEKFIQSYEDGFHILVNEKIIEEVQYLEENNNTPTQIGIEKNFTNDTHKVCLLYFNDNEFFDVQNLPTDYFKEKAITQVKIFENNVLTNEAFYFDTILIENGYDNTKAIRSEIDKSFDGWGGEYFTSFLDATLNCFDGEHDTLLNGISFNPSKRINYLTCHTFPNGNYDETRNTVFNLCGMYQIIDNRSVPQKFKVHDLLECMKPVFSSENIKLSYELNHTKYKETELNLIIHPTINFYRHSIIGQSCSCLVEDGLLSQEAANEINSWQTETTFNPENGRLKGYLGIKLIKYNQKDLFDIEIFGCNGVI